MSTGLTVAILVGCAALICAVYAVYKRGLISGANAEDQTPAASAKS